MNKFKKAEEKIRKLRKLTGWSKTKTIVKLIQIKLNKISLKEYIKYKCYKYTKKTRKNIKNIKKATGWKKRAIIRKINQFNIPSGIYLKYKCYDMTENELKEFYEYYEKLKEKNKRNDRWFENVTMEKCKCSREKAKEKIRISKKKGYYYYFYITKGLYGLSIDELNNLKKYKKGKIKLSKTDKLLKEEIPQDEKDIQKEMNWTPGKMNLEYFKSYVNTGCIFHEWYVFKMYKMPEKLQKEIITTELWRKMYYRYTDYTKNWLYLKEKVMFNKKFKKYIKRDWLDSKNMTFQEFKKFISNNKTFIYKPLDNACGIGIKKITTYNNTILNYLTYFKIKHTKPGIIEEFIKQHKDMARLNPETVNTIRVQTMRVNGKVKVLNATVRMGSVKGSTTDNFSAGGIMANLDIKTGKVITNGSSKFGDVVIVHPVSKVVLKGYQIPCWKNVIKTCQEIGMVLNKMPYTGWDVVINEDSSIQIIEGNHDADCTFHQYCAAVLEKKGIRNTIDEYVWFDDDSKTI